MHNGESDFLSARARKIERALVTKKWTRVHLANVTGYDERTIRNVLSGKAVRNQTILDISQALDIEAELEGEGHNVEVAGELYGAYARTPFLGYEGGFFGFRRSFTSPLLLMRTLFEFAWSDEQECLIFHEHSRFSNRQKVIDHSQNGRVYISPLTDLMHLLTTFQGAVRLITLTKIRGGDEVMRGAILTQSERPMYYAPSISPIVLKKIRDYDLSIHLTMVGPLDDKAEDYEAACSKLDQTEREVLHSAVGRAERAPAALRVV